jgi:hypothetical protein
MLYGRRCRTPLFLNKIGERKVFGPDILQEAAGQVHMVREKMMGNSSVWVAGVGMAVMECNPRSQVVGS